MVAPHARTMNVCTSARQWCTSRRALPRSYQNQFPGSRRHRCCHHNCSCIARAAVGNMLAPTLSYASAARCRYADVAMPRHCQLPQRCSSLIVCSGKGFSSGEKSEGEASSSSATSSTSPVDPDAQIEALEAALKRRRSKKGRVQPRVAVESAVVEQVTGKAPVTPVGQAETTFLQVLTAYFGVLLLEGIALAASGFLPEESDAFIADVLYPAFSPQILLFLGLSSLYGLWKTGKLPGQQQAP